MPRRTPATARVVVAPPPSVVAVDLAWPGRGPADPVVRTMGVAAALNMAGVALMIVIPGPLGNMLASFGLLTAVIGAVGDLVRWGTVRQAWDLGRGVWWVSPADLVPVDRELLMDWLDLLDRAHDDSGVLGLAGSSPSGSSWQGGWAAHVAVDLAAASEHERVGELRAAVRLRRPWQARAAIAHKFVDALDVARAETAGVPEPETAAAGGPAAAVDPAPAAEEASPSGATPGEGTAGTSGSPSPSGDGPTDLSTALQRPCSVAADGSTASPDGSGNPASADAAGPDEPSVRAAHRVDQPEPRRRAARRVDPAPPVAGTAGDPAEKVAPGTRQAEAATNDPPSAVSASESLPAHSSALDHEDVERTRPTADTRAA